MLTNDIPVMPSANHIQPVNYPTVLRGTERLRITPTPLHTDEDEDTLIAALVGARDVFPRWRHLAAAQCSIRALPEPG